MSSGIICLQAETYGSLFHFISSFRIVPVRQEFSPFAWLAGILCLIRFLFLNRYIVCKINYLQKQKSEATTMKKTLSNIISKLPLSKIKHAFGMLVYYLFGKISNGLLFILLGSICLVLGCVFHFPVMIVLGTAVAVSGLVLSFFRENRYIDATAEVKKLKKELVEYL